MIDSRLSAALIVLLLPLVACGQSRGEETTEATSDTAKAAAADAGEDAVAETPARAEQEAPAPTARNREESRPPASGNAASDTSVEAEPEDPTVRTRSVPEGTQVWATLLESLDSESAEAGDRFSAEVSSPLTDGAYVVVPAGSRLLGHLTEVRRTRGDSAAVIAVAFDSLQVREETLPVAATVTDVQIESRSEMKGEGKKIGIGAAAGAVIGAVVGKDVKGAIIGAAGGAAAGTAIALGTQAQYAVLPAGSQVTLRLDEPLEVRMPSEE